MNLLRHPSNIVFLIGFIVYVGIRHVFEQRVKGSETDFRRFGAQEKILISILALGIFVSPALYLFTPVFAFADYRAPKFVMWCGGAVMLTSLWLFWRSHADLGRNFSMTLEIRKNHQLVTKGVYRFIRHPMYASIWLWAIAQALLLQNWVAGMSALIAFAPLYFLRMPREEQMMFERFREKYRDYKNQTGRVFPRLT